MRTMGMGLLLGERLGNQRHAFTAMQTCRPVVTSRRHEGGHAVRAATSPKAIRQTHPGTLTVPTVLERAFLLSA